MLCFCSNVCCLRAWRGDLGVDPSGRPPRLTTPTTMASVPPAQGGVQILGTVVDGHSVFAHGSSSERQDSPRAHDSGHVCVLQRARHVRGDPGCLVSVLFGTEDGLRDGFW